MYVYDISSLDLFTRKKECDVVRPLKYDGVGVTGVAKGETRVWFIHPQGGDAMTISHKGDAVGWIYDVM